MGVQMAEWDRQQRGKRFEGYAFTFCKAAFLVLIFQRYSLLCLSGLAALFYILASRDGVKEWRCWAKPPWVTLFWIAVFLSQLWLIVASHRAASPISVKTALASGHQAVNLLPVHH